MAQENPLLENTKPGLWDWIKDSVLGPVPPPLGQTPYQGDVGQGHERIRNFNTSALDRHAGTPDEEPYLDYFTGKRPWLFAKGDLVDWERINRGGKKLDLEQLLAQGALVRRHPTQSELALLAGQLQLIRRNPLARLGFNPEKTILLEGENNTNRGGMYYPNLDMKFIPVDPRYFDNSLGHESMHAGYTRLQRENQNMPNLSRYSDPEERLIRLLMYTASGDSEKERRPPAYTDWLNFILPSVNKRGNSSDWGKAAREINTTAGTFYRDLQEQQRLLNSWEPRR